jgi:anti-sigma B factor antagonist
MTSRLAVGPEDTRPRDAHAEAILAAVEFRVDVTREHDVVRISPVGDVDVSTIGRVRQELDEAIAAGPGRVILDLRKTTFADSSALHLTVATYDRTARTGTQLAIIPGPPAVQRVFEVAGLSARLPFVHVPRAQRRTP